MSGFGVKVGETCKTAFTDRIAVPQLNGISLVEVVIEGLVHVKPQLYKVKRGIGADGGCIAVPYLGERQIIGLQPVSVFVVKIKYCFDFFLDIGQVAGRLILDGDSITWLGMSRLECEILLGFHHCACKDCKQEKDINFHGLWDLCQK
jgi:hypothetical protein